MAKTHPPDPPSCRAEAVALAGDLGISEQALRGWIKRADIDVGRGQPGALPSAEREELRHRRERQVLRQEREILNKAAASFARETR